MTVEKILRCVCSIDHEDEYGDSGMPHLAPANSMKEHKQYWSIWCPECGRGSKLIQHDSAYLALKDWNQMQEELYVMHNDPAHGLFKEDEEYDSLGIGDWNEC